MDPHRDELSLVLSYQPDLPYRDVDVAEAEEIDALNQAIADAKNQVANKRGGGDLPVPAVVPTALPSLFGEEVEGAPTQSTTGGRPATRRRRPKALATPRAIRPGRTPRKHRHGGVAKL